jgi:pyruvate/2-oxoacid:ferredoxin oxidoreductase alpha subunit
VPVVAPRSPSDAFDAAVEAARMALARLTPMPVLSDGAMVNGSESWRIPAEDELPDLRVELVTGPTGGTGPAGCAIRRRWRLASGRRHHPVARRMPCAAVAL